MKIHFQRKDFAVPTEIVSLHGIRVERPRTMQTTNRLQSINASMFKTYLTSFYEFFLFCPVRGLGASTEL